MSEPWPAYAAVFVLVAIAVHQLQKGFGSWSRSRRERRRRFDALEAPPDIDAADTLRRRSSLLDQAPFLRPAVRLIVQSGTGLSPAKLALIGLGLAVLFAVVLQRLGNPALRVFAGALLATLLLTLWLRIKRGRRLARFGEQLPDVIDVIVRSLRAGHPLAVSLNLVAREMPDPAGTEFALVVDEVNYGRSLTEALDNLAERVGHPELRYFVAAIAIAHQTGGNLGEILSRLARMLRDRFRLARRVRALSAEGRFSGFALSVLPVALFGIINLVSRSYYADFWASPASTPILLISIGLLVVGNAIIYRLVNFKV